MKLLAFDTATAACSAAVWADGSIAARRFAAMRRGHAEALLPMLRATMAEAGLAFDALDAIATTVGPGAFTGLRIGLSAARAIALAARIPVLGVGTLEAVAAAAHPRCAGRALLVALETQRADIYAQFFHPTGEALGPAFAGSVEAVARRVAAAPLAIAGDAAGRVAAVLQPFRPAAAPAAAPVVMLDGTDTADAAVVARMAAERAVKGGMPPADAPPPAPVYLRPPSVTVAAKAPA
ncbi:MAG: tRNA (adenosine(37)-N6)-threonylcarbamoyltransferase complex dimerization subunit type 1 TsaB [Alphaproteobacteria bacterium]